jgi:cytochrome c oxidase subunit 2
MRRPLRSLAGAALALALGACSGVQTMLDPAGEQARDIDVIWRTMLVVCGVMYVLVLGFLAWALWRARARRHLDDAPAAGITRAEPNLERSLTGWAALIVAGLVLLTTVSFLVDRSLAEVGPDPLRIKVTANQWWWDIEYQGETPSENVTTANELHLPVGRPAVIELQANDVIHSFWVPNLSGKTDLIPGRTNQMWFQTAETGLFVGQCAEYCGTQHANMLIRVVVDPPAEFDRWLEREAKPAVVDPAVREGKAVFQAQSCINCHAVRGTPARGTYAPDLTHLMSRRTLASGMGPNTPEDLRRWVDDPQKVKPGCLMPAFGLNDRERDLVVSYLLSLR